MPPRKNNRSRPSNSCGPRTPQSRSVGSRAAKLAPAKRAGTKTGLGVEDKSRHKKSPRKAFAIIGIVFGGVLLVLGILVGVIDGYGQKDRARSADAIVVLGARVRPDGKAGQGLALRVMHAVRLYKKGFAKKIIMTRGVGDNPPSEAQVAADLAVRNGVPREDVVEENKSTSTWENAANASAICRNRGWETVLIVSDPFHLWRAQKNFERCGMRTSVSPVAVEQWQLQPARRLFWTTREAVLVARDWCLRRI